MCNIIGRKYTKYVSTAVVTTSFTRSVYQYLQGVALEHTYYGVLPL